jgi:hypothetical protein
VRRSHKGLIYWRIGLGSTNFNVILGERGEETSSSKTNASYFNIHRVVAATFLKDPVHIKGQLLNVHHIGELGDKQRGLRSHHTAKEEVCSRSNSLSVPQYRGNSVNTT